MTGIGIKISATDAASGVFKTVASEAGRLQGSISAVSGVLSSLGVGLSAGAFLTFVTNINNGVDALNDLKDATGASIENISALEDVARRTGSSFDTVSTSLIKLNQGLSAAKPGSDTERAIKALGLSVSELKALDPAEAFRRIAVSLSGFEDDANKARLTQELFGKSLKEVAPLLKDLAEKGQLNATVTTAQAEAAEKLNKQIFNLQKNALDAGRAITGALVPALSDGVDRFLLAQKHAGGLLETLGLYARLDYSKGIQGNLGNVEKQIAALEERAGRITSDSVRKGNDKAIADLRAQAAYLKELRQLKILGDQGDVGDAVSRKFLNRKTSVGDVLAGDGGKAAASAAAKALADQNRELAEQAKLLATLSGVNGDYQEQLTRLQVVRKSQNISDARYAELVTELIDKQPMVRAIYADQEKSAKAWADQSAASARAVADLSKEYDAYVKTLDASAVAVGNQLQKLQDEELATAIAAAQNISLAQAIEQVTIARLAEAQTKAYANGDQEAGDAIKREIEARKKLATAIGGKEVREANKKAAEDAAKEWQKTADKINDAITDALMRGFENGKGFAENLRDTVENIFKTMVLRPVVQATVNTGLGALGIPGVGGSSGAGGLLNTASNLNTLFGAGSQALFGASVGASSASLLGANAVGAVGGDALGALIAGNGGWAGVSVAAEAGAAAGAASGAAAATTAAGTSAAGALAAIPGWGWALGGALLLAGLTSGDNGPKLASTGDAIRRYDKGGALTENATNGAWFFTNTDDANKLLDGLESRYQKAAKALGIGTVATQFDYGSNNRGNFALAGAAGNSRANTGEIAYSAEAMQVAASRAVFAALQGSELPKYLSGLLDSVGDINALSQTQIDDLLNTAQAFKGLHDVMVQMPFDALHDLSYDAAKGLIEFSGGLDKLTQNLGTYYENFYSAEEKKAQTLANITRTLTDAGALTKTTRTAIAGEFDVQVGAQGDARLEQRYATSVENLDMPKTREEFRALVESMKDLGGESAQKAYTALMSVSGAFASVTPAAADAAAALEKDLAARATWQQKLDVLTGKTTERALSLQADLAGTTDAATQALIRQVYAQEDLATATQAAAEAAAEATRTAIEAGQTSRAALLGNATSAAQDAFGTLSRSVAAQRAQDAAAYQAQRAIATAAYTSQNDLYQQQIDATRQSLDSVGNSVGKLQSLSGSLKSTLDGMRIAGSDGAYRADAQAQISAAVARARSGGGLPVDGQLASALSTVSKPSEQLFGTFQDYARDFYKTANDIASLSSLTDSQLTADQVTQGILQTQIQKLDDQKRTLKDGFAEQVSTLDDILTNAQRQLDAANGLNVSVLSVADALKGFASAISALETTRAGQGLATTVNAGTAAVSGQRQADILQYLQGVNSNTQLSDFEKAQTVYTRAQIEGVTEAEIARAWGASEEEARRWFGNAGIPKFAQGINYLPNDTMAMLHKGEMVVPAAYNPFNPNAQGAQNNNRLETLLASINEKLQALQATQERGNAHADRAANALEGQNGPILMEAA